MVLLMMGVEGKMRMDKQHNGGKLQGMNWIISSGGKTGR